MSTASVTDAGGGKGAGQNLLNVDGTCVQGEHPNVLKAKSARTLAACIANFTK